jgi:flagellar motor switch protein FliN/FliY
MAEMELAKVESDAPVEPNSTVEALPWMMRIEEHASWSLLSQMTVATTAGISLSGFKVGDLLRLKPGQILESGWPHTEDIPVKVGHVQVAWSEFEVVDQHLMIRLTRLA